jgi:hypothetical protein
MKMVKQLLLKKKKKIKIDRSLRALFGTILYPVPI